MITKVQKWGNSLGLRIPKALAKEAGLVDGVEVSLSAREGKIVAALVQKKKRKPRYTLDELLAKVTPKNKHRSVWPDDPVGKEFPF